MIRRIETKMDPAQEAANEAAEVQKEIVGAEEPMAVMSKEEESLHS